MDGHFPRCNGRAGRSEDESNGRRRARLEDGTVREDAGLRNSGGPETAERTGVLRLYEAVKVSGWGEPQGSGVVRVGRRVKQPENFRVPIFFWNFGLIFEIFPNSETLKLILFSSLGLPVFLHRRRLSPKLPSPCSPLPCIAPEAIVPNRLSPLRLAPKPHQWLPPRLAIMLALVPNRRAPAPYHAPCPPRA